MGSIIRDSRGRSPYFYLLYKNAEGRWIKKSSHTSDKAKAKLMLHGTTCNHAFKTLSDVFADAHKERLIESNFAQLKALKAEKPGRVGFTRNKFRQFFWWQRAMNTAGC